MTSEEKYLYHQIHPLKLVVDFSTGFYTTYLLWYHDIPRFLAFFLLPSVVVTLALIRFADIEKLKESSFGEYISKYMTPTIVIIRTAGQIIMWVAGWYRLPILISAGILIVIGGWCNGLVFKKAT